MVFWIASKIWSSVELGSFVAFSMAPRLCVDGIGDSSRMLEHT